MNAILISLLFSASPADDIDKLFEKAAALENDGDCTGAADVYTDVTGLAAGLPAADKKRIDAQIKARQAKNKACVEACTMSDKDKRMFEQVKQSQQDGELKRVAEMCKVLMHGKNQRCSQWAEVRQLCPQLGEGGDPCGVSADTKAELEKLQKDVEALEKKAGRAAYSIKSDNPKGLDAVANASRELDAAYERIFDLRERYFQCDKVYGGLKLEANTLGKARGTLRVALNKAYKVKLDKFKEDLDALTKSKEEVDAKVDKLTQFTNDVALDVMSLAQTESVRSSVKVEGVAQSNAENLAKVLQGDREAMDAMIKANPGHFDGQGREGLLRKKDSLERLDQMLTKLAEQGYGERLGFKTAQQEVKATLALVMQVLPPEGDSGPFPWGPLGIGFGVASIAAALFFFWTRREKSGGTPEAAGVRVSLGARKPLGGATAAAKAPEAPAASEPAAAKKSGGGMLKMGGLGKASKPADAPKKEESAAPSKSSSPMKLGSRPPLSGKFGSKPAAKAPEAPKEEAKPAPMAMEESTSVSAPEVAMPEAKPLPPPPAPLPKVEAAEKPAEKAAEKPATQPPPAQKPKLERPGIKLLSRR